MPARVFGAKRGQRFIDRSDRTNTQCTRGAKSVSAGALGFCGSSYSRRTDADAAGRPQRESFVVPGGPQRLHNRGGRRGTALVDITGSVQYNDVDEGGPALADEGDQGSDTCMLSAKSATRGPGTDAHANKESRLLWTRIWLRHLRIEATGGTDNYYSSASYLSTTVEGEGAVTREGSSGCGFGQDRQELRG